MNATVAPSRAVTIAEAAGLLRVHRTTIWRMQRDGQIVVIRIRGKRVVPIAEIERLLAGGEGARSPRNTDPVDPDPVGVPVGTPVPPRIEKRRLYPRVAR